MRWYLIVGMILLGLAAVFCVISLAIPDGISQQVNVTLPDGNEGVLAVDLPQRGWAGDWALVSVRLSSAGSGSTEQPLSIRFKLETTDAESQPDGSIQTVILPGEETSASWKVRSSRKGTIENILWVFSKVQGGEEQLLYAKAFSYSSLYYWFLPPPLCRGIVIALAIIGVVLIVVPKTHHLVSSK